MSSEKQANGHIEQTDLISKDNDQTKDQSSKDISSEEEFVAPDGGFWGWVVCITSFWCNGTLFGILNTFGILFVALMQEFEDSGDEDLAFKICKYIQVLHFKYI